MIESNQVDVSHMYTRLWFDKNEEVPLESIITSQRTIDGMYVTLSCYGDDVWFFPDVLFPSSIAECNRKIDFNIIKNKKFISALKLAMMRYYYLGRPGYKRPRGTSLIKVFRHCAVFLNYLADKNILELSEVSAFVGVQYAEHSRMQPGLKAERNTPVSVSQRLIAVESLYELLLNSRYAFSHPWPDATTGQLAGPPPVPGGKTLIIPDEHLRVLMKKSTSLLSNSDDILLNMNRLSWWVEKKYSQEIIDHLLSLCGYHGGAKGLNEEIFHLRSACALIVLITTGIRAHEILSLEVGCCFSTTDEDGTKYCWIRGVSTKTGVGATEWLCPAICHQAVIVLEKISKPLRNMLSENVMSSQVDISPLKASKNYQNKNKLFLLKPLNKKISIRPLNFPTFQADLKKFVLHCGVQWNFSTHQCRRTFAVYVVKNALGDLRYLRDHFKHWSIDMTAMYAENELQDKELFGEIYVAACDEKYKKIRHWLDPDTPLSGGMAQTIKVFRSKGESIRYYKNHSEMVQNVSESIYLRATGVAWCTADLGGCDGGKAFDNTKCGDCRHSVIDDRFLPRWKAIYNQQLELIQLEDIGIAGKDLAHRALDRCKKVLTELGAPLEVFEA